MKGDLAHVFNRGVDKRKIFLDNHDYQRFVDNLFLLNNVSGKIRTERENVFDGPELMRNKLVEILKWSLLPNHYHLLLYEREEGGIVEFTKRLGNAYTKYFNSKNEGRSGYLFQNSAKIVPILHNSQFLYIPFYIDLNCLSLRFPDWKSKSVGDATRALEFLRINKWSSYKDYFGSKPSIHESVINQELFYEHFDTNSKQYEKELLTFLKRANPSTWQVDGLGSEFERV